MKPRIGVIGYGLMGQLLARVVSEHSDAELGGLADPAGYRETGPVNQRASRSPQELGVRLYASCEELLDQEALDAVIISTPEDRSCAAPAASSFASELQGEHQAIAPEKNRRV